MLAVPRTRPISSCVEYFSLNTNIPMALAITAIITCQPTVSDPSL